MKQRQIIEIGLFSYSLMLTAVVAAMAICGSILFLGADYVINEALASLLVISIVSAMSILLTLKNHRLHKRDVSAKDEYFIRPTSLNGCTQYDVDRAVLRASKGDYDEGVLSRMLGLDESESEADFVSRNISTAKEHFKLYNLIND